MTQAQKMVRYYTECIDRGIALQSNPPRTYTVEEQQAIRHFIDVAMNIQDEWIKKMVSEARR